MLGTVALPAIAARLIRQRHGPGLPDLLAGVDVISLHAAARAIFAAAEACNDLVMHHDRRRRNDRALLVIDDVGCPKLLAGLGVDRGQLAVQAADEDLALGKGHAAGVDVAAGVLQHVVRDLRLILPSCAPVLASSA